MTHIPIPLSVSDHPLESMPQTLTHFSWIPKHLSGLLRQLKRAQTTRPQTCQKKQHTQGQILKKKIPLSPQTPALHPLRTPLLCLGKNVWWKRPNEEKERKARGAATEEDPRKRAGGNPTTEMRRGDMWCRRCRFFIFPTHGLNQKWNQTKTNGLKLNFTQWNETKY